MGERQEFKPQETSLIPRSWEELKNKLLAAKAYADQTHATGKELFKDAEIRTGGEAALRGVLNIALSCIDIVPGVGELASWGADAAAIVEDIRYRQRKKEAEARGEDPGNVKHEKYNLTPDVHVLVKTLTELLELIPIPFPFMIPTHAIETVGQLYFDVPRIYKALKKTHNALQRIREQREKAQQAARVFRPEDPHKSTSDEDPE